MNASVRRLILMIAIVSLAALPAFAQEPEFLFVWEDHVNPGRAVDNEAALTKTLSVAASIKHPYPWITAVRDDMIYYYVTPVADWADVQKLGDAYMKLTTKMGPEMIRETEGVSEFGEATLWMIRPDLSYMPDPLLGDPNTQTFRHWTFFYVRPGHEAQFEEYMKKFVEMNKAQKSTLGWQSAAGFFGTDSPVYVAIQFAETESAFWAANEKETEKAGEKVWEVWNETLTHVRKLENVGGQYLPDLSYTPE